MVSRSSPGGTRIVSLLMNQGTVQPWEPGLLQHPLAAGHLAGAAWIDFGGHAQRPRKGLEAGFNDVVRVHPIQLADVQGEAGIVGHGHEELLHQFGVVAADLLGRDREPKTQVGAAGAIKRHLHQGLIKRSQKVPEAVDALAIPQGLTQGLAQGDPHILIGVVVIDVGVTAGTDLQIKQPVAADLMEHVIEEGHAGAHLALAAAIEPHAHLYIGFTGDPMHLSTAHADLLDTLLMQQSSPRAQP